MRNLTQHVSDPIPYDLLVDIFSRVPAKSVARFRCVSKLWTSILGRPYFPELFFTRSSTRPRLLFIFQKDGKLFFYSSPQLQNPDENSSLVATRYNSYSLNDFSSKFCTLCGLVFVYLQDQWEKDWLNVNVFYNPRKKKEPVNDDILCNPITRESITLPKLDFKTKSYLGYDPINKQFKVLTWKQHKRDIMCGEYRVLTLESGKNLWTMIKCEPHHPTYNRICINGILYYRADFKYSSMIVCFDVRYEKFNFIKMDENLELHYSWTLINYNGKLGAVQLTDWRRRDLELWVLEDVGEHKWSKHIYVLPLLWSKQDMLFSIGMTSRGDILFSPNYHQSGPFYVFYYNLERNTLIKVEVQGFEEFNNHYFYTFMDYLENVNAYASI